MTDKLAGYLAQIRVDYPTLDLSSARLNSDGIMNDVVVINDDLVFRFAKHERARALLAYEAQLLPIVKRSVTLQVPHIEHRTDGYLSYRYVPGIPLYLHTLLRADQDTQDRFACELAIFLRELHSVPVSDLPVPPWQAQAPSESRRTFYERRLAALEWDVYPLLWADQKAWIGDLYAPVLDGRVDLDAYAPVLIHRDLASYHILHDHQAGHLTGIIDFGTARAGDPAADWGCLINTYGERFVRRMHQEYPVSQATMDRARFLAGALELEWALNGVQAKDLSLLLVHLGRARDRQPTLTPWP